MVKTLYLSFEIGAILADYRNARQPQSISSVFSDQAMHLKMIIHNTLKLTMKS